MIVNFEYKNDKKQLIISHTNDVGKIVLTSLTIPKNQLYKWEVIEKGNPEKHHAWDTKDLYWNRVEKVPSYNLSINRIYEILFSLPEATQQKIFHGKNPKTVYVDIETEYDNLGVDAERMAQSLKVTAICWGYDNEIYTCGIKPLSGEEVERMERELCEYFNETLTFKYYYYESEIQMLDDFFNIHVPGFDCITGWNFINFDWLYLTTRSRVLGIDITEKFPTGKIYLKTNIPYHKMVVDYMQVYNKFDRTITVKENSTLDFVATTLTGLSKIRYKGSLKEMFDNDYYLYIYYNAVDTWLVKRIEQKIHALDIFFKLGDITYVEYQKTLGTVAATEVLMIKELKKQNRILIPKEYSKIPSKTTQFEGAYVKTDVKPGIYNWSCIFDFASLYPTISNQWNISPDTKHPGTPDNLSNYTHSAAGFYFSKNFDGIFRILIKSFYGKRKEVKNRMKDIDIEIDRLKKLKFNKQDKN